jgi:hypothetical protein
MSSGVTIGVQQLINVVEDQNGGLWLEVNLLLNDELDRAVSAGKLRGAPSKRRRATINAANVLAVLELSDT